MLVTENLKTATAEFVYCRVMYKYALKFFERKFGQEHVLVSAHLEKLKSFRVVKAHNNDSVIDYCTIK